MTGKQFFDWQTSGGTDDVMRLVDCLERADVPWCCIGDVAVNHWAEQQMVTRDVDLVIALDAIDKVAGSAGIRSNASGTDTPYRRQPHGPASRRSSAAPRRRLPKCRSPAFPHNVFLVEL
jgi:hypothetical protein